MKSRQWLIHGRSVRSEGQGVSLEFCSRYDEALAGNGPAAVFLVDCDGNWRHDSNWTRDCWESIEPPLFEGAQFALLRDIPTGFVQLMLVTSKSLLSGREGIEVRWFEMLEDARSELAALGQLPIVKGSW